MTPTGNRKMDEPSKKWPPSIPSAPARPVLGGEVKAAPVNRPPDAGLNPVKPAPAQPQGTPVVTPSSLKPTYNQAGAGSDDAALRRSFTQDTFMSQLNGAAGQNTQGAGFTIPESALNPTYGQGAADPDAPAAAGTTVTNSSPFDAPTGTPTSTEYPTVVPGKVYTQAELVAFQQAMSAADMAAMKERQQTMYRAGRYSAEKSGDGWVSIPLASGGYYEYRAEPEWQDYWSTSPNYGTTGSPGAGTGTGGAGSPGTGTGGAGTDGMFDDLVGGANPADKLTTLLEEWKKAAAAQANGQIDFAVQQGILDLERALADSKAQFKEQAESVAKDEMQALDNSALYAEMRGDKGGIGQSQYNEIQAAAAQNRLAVQQAQTKLSTDTARQIADLRAKGEFEKADKLLEITQTFLSQLISLEQWAAEFGLTQKQFEASLRQWQAEFNLAVDEFNFGKDKWKTEFDYGVEADKREWALQLMSMGFNPSDSDLQLLGLTRDQWNTWKAEQQVTGGNGNGGGGSDTAANSNDWSKYVDTEVLNALAELGYTSDTDASVLRTAMLTRKVSKDVVDDLVDMYQSGNYGKPRDGRTIFEGLSESERKTIATAAGTSLSEFVAVMEYLFPNKDERVAMTRYLYSTGDPYKTLLAGTGGLE